MSRLRRGGLLPVVLCCGVQLAACRGRRMRVHPSAPPAASRPASRPTSRPASAPASALTRRRPRLPAADRAGAGVRLVTLPWHRKVELLAKRRVLGRAFSARGYRPPNKALVMAARVWSGVEQPACEYYSLGGTGFRYSYPGRFFPASAVKLSATTAALWSLYRRGITGTTRVAFVDPDGKYDGPVKYLYRKVLLRSWNTGYNRLMLLGGIDAINDRFFTVERGLPRIALQSRYGARIPGATLRRSPTIYYWIDGKRRSIAPRVGKTRTPGCPGNANCVTLYALQEVMRRVMLHFELPRQQRLRLHPADVRAVQALLLKARNRLQPAVSRALGHPAAIHNNVGRVPLRDLLENAFIVDKVTKRRFLLAVNVPFTLRHDTVIIRGRLSKLAGQTLRALLRRPRGVVLQRDAGTPMRVAVSCRGRRRCSVEVFTRGADDLRAWADHRPLKVAQRRDRLGRFDLAHRFASAGEHVLVLEALRDGERVGYRAVGIRVGAPMSAAKRTGPKQ